MQRNSVYLRFAEALPDKVRDVEADHDPFDVVRTHMRSVFSNQAIEELVGELRPVLTPIHQQQEEPDADASQRCRAIIDRWVTRHP